MKAYVPKHTDTFYLDDYYLQGFWTREYSFKKLEKLLSLLPFKKDVAVDLGCGQGYFLLSLSFYFKSVYGIDKDVDIGKDSKIPFANTKRWKKEVWGKSVLQLAHEMIIRERGVDNNIFLIKSDIRRIPFGNEVADVVSLLEVLEHLRNKENALKEIYRILKPGGIFICSVPNTIGFANVLRNFSARFAGLREDDPDTSDHKAFHWQRDCVQLINKYFRVKEIHGFPIEFKSLALSILVKAEKV